MIKPLIECVLAYNLNAKEQLEIVRHYSVKFTHGFANKTHQFWFSVLDNRWYKFPVWDEVGIFNNFYSFDQRRYDWLKEQVS